MNSNLLSQIIMLAMSGQLGGKTVVQNPKTETIVNSLKTIAGKDKMTSKEEVEKQISIFDTQLSTMQVFAAIPQLAPYINPMLANINTQKNALKLVYDNFKAFSGGDDYIDKYDRANILEAAETDGNETDFSEEDLEELHYINDIDYDPEEDFNLSSIKFDSQISNKSGDQNREFDEDQSEKNIHIKDSKGDDTYTIGEDVEDSNLVFTELDEGDKLNLKGLWSIKQIEDSKLEEDYVLYTNKDTGTNVFVKGTIDDVYDLVKIDKLDKDFSKFDEDNPEKTRITKNVSQQDKLINKLYETILKRNAEMTGGFDAWERDTGIENTNYGINLADGVTEDEQKAMLKTFIKGSISELDANNVSKEDRVRRICEFIGVDPGKVDINAIKNKSVDEIVDAVYKAK